MARSRIAFLMFFVFLCCGMAAAQGLDDQQPLSDFQTIDETSVSDDGTVGMQSTTSANGFTLSTSVAYFDNHINCKAIYARNCFAQTTPGSVVQLSVGFDGYVAGINASGIAYNLPASVDGHTQASFWPQLSLGSNNKAIAVGSRQRVYLLLTSTCAGAFQIAKANSSLTGKTILPGCLSQLAATPDGALSGVNQSTHVAYYSYNDGAAWGILGGSWKKFVLVSKQLGFALSTGNVPYRVNIPSGGSAVATSLGGSGTDISGSTTDVWVTDSTGAPYFYDLKGGVGWQKMAGSVHGIAGGGAFFFGLVGSQPYHFVALASGVQSTVSGVYNACASQCRSVYVHSATASIAWSAGGLNGTTGSTQTVSGTPLTYLNAQAIDINWSCDTIFGNPSSFFCQFTSRGTANCSGMGSLFGNSFQSLFGDHFRFAYVRVVTNGAPYNCRNVAGRARCNNPVKPWCSNTIAPVPWNPPYVDDWVVTNPLTFWDTHAICVRVTLSSPFHCAGEGFLRTEAVPLPMQPDCSLFY